MFKVALRAIKKQFFRHIVIFSVLFALMILAVLYSNILIYKAGQKGIHSVSDAPQADAAIVLGAMVNQDSSLSTILADRMDIGIELYKKGKVKKLLVTGDHGHVNYDEVNAMRKYAMERGIPEENIFMDHAGFSTYDSMYRARDIFMVNKAIIVTQKFHLPRAVYIARGMGLEASGVPSDKRKYFSENYLYFRELFARTKAVVQLSLGAKPKFLGQAIPISGDGRATKD